MTASFPLWIIFFLILTSLPGLKRMIQTNDVDFDYRGLIYITDRAGASLHILEFLGGKCF
jgi:hypothetical protein